MILFRQLIPLLVCVAASHSSYGQAVAVTATLDRPQIKVGESATLHVYAQIVPALRAGSDRIFSWYVDVLDSNGPIAQLDPAGLLKTASDNNPQISSPGKPQGANLRAIYDTFINGPGAGRDTAVELFSIPIHATGVGSAVFTIQAGTTIPELAEDFIVAPSAGGDPFVGGDYSAASVTLTIPLEPPQLHIALRPDPDTQKPEAVLSFDVVPGANYFVEFRDSLDPQSAWQPLPGGPHNSGQIVDPLGPAARFYRLRALLQ
jgi:hypothetical protein